MPPLPLGPVAPDDPFLLLLFLLVLPLVAAVAPAPCCLVDSLEATAVAVDCSSCEQAPAGSGLVRNATVTLPLRDAVVPDGAARLVEAVAPVATVVVVVVEAPVGVGARFLCIFFEGVSPVVEVVLGAAAPATELVVVAGGRTRTSAPAVFSVRVTSPLEAPGDTVAAPALPCRVVTPGETLAGVSGTDLVVAVEVEDDTVVTETELAVAASTGFTDAGTSSRVRRVSRRERDVSEAGGLACDRLRAETGCVSDVDGAAACAGVFGRVAGAPLTAAGAPVAATGTLESAAGVRGFALGAVVDVVAVA